MEEINKKGRDSNKSKGSNINNKSNPNTSEQSTMDANEGLNTSKSEPKDEHKDNIHDEAASNKHSEVLPTKHDEEPPPKSSTKDMILSWRFIIVILLHFSHVAGRLPKFGVPMAIVCMIPPSDFSTSQDLNNSSGQGHSHNMTTLPDSGLQEYEFDWSSETVGLIITAQNTAFLSPMISDVVRGYIGNKLTLALSFGLSSALTLLSPVAARISPYVLVALTAVQGLVAQANYVIMIDTIPWWTPLSEKITLNTIMITGTQTANILGNFVAGFLCTIPIDNGWPFIFYVFGGFIAVYVVIWCVISSRRPEDHPFITEKELHYIKKHRADLGSSDSAKPERPPYSKIFKSVPILSYLLASGICMNALLTYFAYLPIYVSNVLHFSPENTGTIASLAGVCWFFGCIVLATLGNKLTAFGFDTNKVRKICLFCGLSLTSVSMFIIAGLDPISHRYIVVVLVMFASVGVSSVPVILAIVPQDMAPRYAGFLSGVWMTSSTIVQATGPLIVANIAPNNTVVEWRILWIVFAAAFSIGTVIFLIFGDASLQTWAVPDHKDLTSNVEIYVNKGFESSNKDESSCKDDR